MKIDPLKPKSHIDVKAKVEGKKWLYTDEVRDHFFNPRNIFKTQKEAQDYEKEADGMGLVGSPACGDMMKIWIKVKDDRINECKWQTFGCASAIASTSMLSVMLTRDGGMKLDDALKIKPQDIVTELGSLPARKFHCSVLGDKALRAAINDHFKKSKQLDRFVSEGSKVIDLAAKVTDKDIEEEILEMGDAVYNSTEDDIFEVLQKNLKVGVGDKSCVPQVYQLIRFYKEKYFSDE